MLITTLIAFLPVAAPAEVTLTILQPLDSSIASLVAPQTTPAESVSEWTGSVALSAISTDGNTESEAYSFDATAERRRSADRLTVKAYLNYGTSSASGTSILTQRKMGTSLQYDYFLDATGTTYVYGNGALHYDALATLDMRRTVGAGGGYQFREEKDSKLSCELGLAHGTEDFQGAPGFPSPPEDFLAFRLGANLFERINEDLTLTSSGEVLPSMEDSDDILGKLDTKLAMSLSEAMFISLQWVMEYDNTPSMNIDRVDNRFVLSLGWSF